MKDHPNSDINELIITGLIVSRVRWYQEKCVFTLENSSGRFFVLWRDPEWRPLQGQQVMVRGEIYSVLYENKHNTRVRANNVTGLQTQERENV